MIRSAHYFVMTILFKRRPPGNALAWVALLAMPMLVVGCLQRSDPRQALTPDASQVAATPTSTPKLGATVAPEASPTSAPVVTSVPLDLPEITPPPRGQVYQITPAAGDIGWTSSTGNVANNFGDYNVYAGIFEGQTRLGAMQFDLSKVPPGSEIVYADLSLTGLTDQWLNRDQEDNWTVHLLAPYMDPDWPSTTHGDLAWGFAAETMVGSLQQQELGSGQTNTLVLPPAARQALQDRLFAGQVSFRVAGPETEQDNLFSWDSGRGTESRFQGPLLRIAAGPPPEQPPATPTPNYVLITPAGPTPENVVTAAAMAASQGPAQAAPEESPGQYQAAERPTATPLPPNWVTPIIVTPTPTPANEATKQWLALVATAEVMTTGTATATPPNVWTATPTPTWFVVTLTPTPASAGEAIALAAAEATRRATEGTPTPLPPNWVTATPAFVMVTATPTPLSVLTAQADSVAATVAALLSGTATPTPGNWITPTPLPLVIAEGRLPPTPTPTGTPGVDQIPGLLRGRIVFWSDRLGEPQLFVMDPDGGNVGWLTQSYPYEAARAQEAGAPDGVRRVIIQPAFDRQLQLHVVEPGQERPRGITDLDGDSYDAAWSPAGDRITFVSIAPGNDEIYIVAPDGTNLQRLTFNDWEWDKHPSWSPEGSQIVFYSNRETGRRQIWIMNADGSNPRNISANAWNDWDPIWIK